MVTFELIAQDSKTGARAGILHTPHGDIPTPVFMPVGTQGTVKLLPWRDLYDFDARIVLGNTYHLYLRPGHKLIAKLGGLHRFVGWDRAMLTDSGGFQVFSLSELRKITEDGVKFQSHHDGSYHFLTPELATEIQYHLRPDIMMAFDECVSYPCDHNIAARAADRTFRWLTRCNAEISRLTQTDSSPETIPALFGIIQGSTFPDLRRYSLDQITSVDLPGYAIGGLSVGEPKDEMFGMLDEIVHLMPFGKPRYLMGVGKPTDIIGAVAVGVDMFDCVLPTRNARNSSVYTWRGKMSLKASYYAEDTSPIDENCKCYVCQNHSRAYIRHLFSVDELLGAYLTTHHAIYFYLDLLREIRRAIIDNRYYDFMQDFARSFSEDVIHP